ncbi:MAG: transglutaminaseTgpA domain-containing protein, partial [Pseudomonadales bacterium]|nr:transglutaminaseTgpA domain-containing protein [Pseudomonadales bacterium]
MKRVGAQDAVPGAALVLLLVAHGAAVLPHVPRLSPWILLVWVLCVLWRTQVFRGNWNFPPTWVKALLVILAALGVGLAYPQPFALEPAVALLVVAFSLKLLETRARRDAVVVVMQGYFVVACEFLFEQSMTTALRQLLAVTLLTGALVAVHQGGSARSALASLRTATVLLLQAVPLTVVMFVFFPRIAPLWSVPLPEGAGRTGLADSMSPGDIARLGRSSELAFRVEFDGAVPPPSALYWRVLTYSDYEDGTWSPGPRPHLAQRLVHWAGSPLVPDWIPEGPEARAPIRYAVVAEPSFRPWLYALDLPQPLSAGTGIGRDFRLVAREAVTTRLRYEVASRPWARLDETLPDWLRRRETRLPPDGDPRTRALVAELAERHREPRALVVALLRRFREEPFVYTLSPPTLSGDRIDGFLFETRAGFCAHFAGAFVYMMRIAGVPARVVAGYQGGEANPLADHLVVRQYDAHAWSEVWLEGEGWVRVDPTAAVAPGRIEQGAEASLAREAAAGGVSPFRGEFWRSLSWVMDAAYFLDSLEHRWNVLVLSYDADSQSRLLQRLLGEITPLRVGIAAGGAGVLAVLLSSMAGWIGPRPRRRPPILRLHDALGAAFAGVGMPRRLMESPRAYGRRLARSHPAQAEDILRLAELLDQR